MLFALSIAVNVWFAEDTMAQSGAMYRVRWEAKSLPMFETGVFPCELGDPIYYDGRWQLDAFGIEDDNDARFEYIIRTYDTPEEWHIHTHSVPYIVHYTSFDEGEDGNPHLAGANLVTCEFLGD